MKSICFVMKRKWMKWAEKHLNLSGGQVVDGSNPVVPTIINKGLQEFLPETLFSLGGACGRGSSFFCVNFPEIDSMAEPMAPSNSCK